MSENKKVRAADHEYYGLYSIIALIFPLIGAILAVVMLAKDQKIDKKLGEHTLVCSIFGFILSGIIWTVWINANATSNMPLSNGY